MTKMVLGTVVSQSNFNGFNPIFGLAFDGCRIAMLHTTPNLRFATISRQNFVSAANFIDDVAIAWRTTTMYGLTYDGRNFWIIEPVTPRELQCFTHRGTNTLHLVRRSGVAAGLVLVGLAFDGKHVLSCGTAGWIFWVNPQTGIIIDSWQALLGHDLYDCTWDGKYLWVTDPVNNLVWCLNLASRAVVTNFAFPPGPDINPVGITFDGKYLWIGTYNGGAGGTLYCVEKD